MMRAAFFLVTTAALAMMVSAQAAEQKPTTQPAATQNPVTIVGCLEQGGTATAPDKDGYFLRTPALTLPVGSSVAVGGSGATGRATTSAGAPNTTALYQVTGIDRAELRPHVGHRVELQGRLTGNLDPASSGTTAKTTVDATGKPTTTVERRMDVAGVLNATTLKMVESSCK